MSIRSGLLALTSLSLVATACASGGAPDSTGFTAGTGQTTLIDALSDGEVLVAATGTLVTDGNSLELCPPRQVSGCAGIEVLESIDPFLVSEPGAIDEAQLVRIEGRYNGRRMDPTSIPQQLDPSALFGTDFTTPCEELRGADARGNPAEDLTTTVVSYTQANADTFAAWWWDSTNGVANVWFTGNPSRHRVELERLVDPAAICVLGGADYTEGHLREVQRTFSDSINSGDFSLDVAVGSIDALANRYQVTVEAIDQNALEALNERYGDALVLFAFIELLESPIESLPPYIPVGPNEIDLVTSRFRFGGGMDALGRFEVRYDPDLECFYLSNEIDRDLPVWPFGYSAGNNPIAVYDEDGNLVAAPGDQIEAGGGGIPLDRVDATNTCEATGVWVFNGDPIALQTP